jgi:chemotaxis protein CheC
MTYTVDQIDAIKEIINVGVGRGAKVLNGMLGAHVQLQVPTLKILSPDEFTGEMQSFNQDPLSCVSLPFQGNTRGVAELVFPRTTASRLIDVLVQDESDYADMDSIRAATLTEVGNIVLNAVMGSISNILKFRLTYSIPQYANTEASVILPLGGKLQDMTILLAQTHFLAQELAVEGNIMLFLEIASFDKLVAALDQPVAAETS